jgi:hypothetical protein
MADFTAPQGLDSNVDPELLQGLLQEMIDAGQIPPHGVDVDPGTGDYYGVVPEGEAPPPLSKDQQKLILDAFIEAGY